MRVVKASYAGACYGVQRALDMAVEASASGEGASTLGPLTVSYTHLTLPTTERV